MMRPRPDVRNTSATTQPGQAGKQLVTGTAIVSVLIYGYLVPLTIWAAVLANYI